MHWLAEINHRAHSSPSPCSVMHVTANSDFHASELDSLDHVLLSYCLRRCHVFHYAYEITFAKLLFSFEKTDGIPIPVRSRSGSFMMVSSYRSIPHTNPTLPCASSRGQDTSMERLGFALVRCRVVQFVQHSDCAGTDQNVQQSCSAIRIPICYVTLHRLPRNSSPQDIDVG